MKTCLRTPVRPPRGVTLIVALIMLTALGLLAAFAVKSGTTNLLIVNNTQARHEAYAAAQTAVERTISTPLFSQQPAAVAANAIPVDVDSDGVADVDVRLTPAPACYRWRSIKVGELDPTVQADRACLGSGVAINAGIDTGTALPVGDSMCADSEWNVRAVATSAATGAQVTVNQGVALRGLITDVTSACP